MKFITNIAVIIFIIVIMARISIIAVIITAVTVTVTFLKLKSSIYMTFAFARDAAQTNRLYFLHGTATVISNATSQSDNRSLQVP